MYASNYFEEKMLNLLRGQNITAPSTLYLGLFLSNPSDTGSAGTEISYSGYARKAITFSAPAASGNNLYMQNTAEIKFAESSTSAGTVQYVGVFDSLTGGNMLLYGQLTSSLVVQNGVSPVFRAGSVKWTWSGNLSTYYRTAIMNTLRGTSLNGFTPKIGLCEGDPTGSGAEFSGNNYSRISVTFSAPSNPSGNVAATVQNSAQITSAVSSGAWGDLSHVAIYDAATGGHVFAVKQLGTTYTINANASIGFAAAAIKMSIN